MFNFIKNKLSSIYSQVTTKISSLFASAHIDAETLKELEKILITADTGVKTTKTILTTLQNELKAGNLNHGQDLKQLLAHNLLTLLPHNSSLPEEQAIYLLVGINGSGKTTLAGKLAALHRKNNKKVLLAAGDTFRAGATQQLQLWGDKTQSTVISGIKDQDPASVIFTACQEFKKNSYDTFIIDTAGRLQTKTNLMRELEKIKRIIQRELPDKKIYTLLTVDAMLGQNSFEQAKIFHESTTLDGICLTKMDGTAKGGIVFAIYQELHIPIVYISFGEQPENFKQFNAQEYIEQLLNHA